MTEWSVPGTIVRVVEGAVYTVDLDLGWRVHLITEVRSVTFGCVSFPSAGWLEAKKQAQRLLPSGAGVWIKSHAVGPDVTEAEIEYASWWQPLSEEGSLRTAMIASGHAYDRLPARGV